MRFLLKKFKNKNYPDSQMGRTKITWGGKDYYCSCYLDGTNGRKD
jgi:hypothetical protein